MRKLGKMENVTLLKIGVDFDIQFRTFRGYEFRGVAWYRIGLKLCKVQFLYLSESEYKVAYLTDSYYWEKHNKIPTDRLQREALLVLIRGEIEKYFGRCEQINYFKKVREEEEQERIKKEEEEKAKRIELGEQISIDKYLLNK